MQSWGIRPISLVGLWHVERGVGYLKSWENCMSTMTRSGPPVAMPKAVSSSYIQANFSAVTKTWQHFSRAYLLFNRKH